MKGVNKAILLGFVGKDPELSYTPSGVAVCKFSIATNESWKDSDGNKQEKTEWHNIVAWKKLAEICGQYVTKGSPLYIEGKITTRSWEKDGKKNYMTEIIANDVVMLGKSEAKTGTADVPSAQTAAVENEKDDLPF